MEKIITASWIVPMCADDSESEPTLLQDHALVIGKRGEITDLLPLTQAKQKYSQTPIDTLDHHILMPGLINTHSHAAMSLFRGLADDLPLMEWLNNHIWPAEAKWVCNKFVKAGTELAIAEMISSGTTCMADMYFYPDTVAEAALSSQFRAVLSCPVIDFPTNWANDAAQYISKAEDVHAQFRGEDLVRVGIGPHAPYTVSDEPLTQCLNFADKLDTHIQIHLHETEQEVNDALANNQFRPTERLDKLGFFSSRVSAVHMTALNQSDIEIIAKRDASIVHCPISNLKLASGFCPVEQVHQKGINVSLGTDGAASNNNLDMFGEIKSSAILAKAITGNAAALPAYRALRMATINGAKAIGLDSLIGSLEVGKQADIVAVDTRSPHTVPLFNPISQLAYSVGREQVSHVWVAGKPLLQNRRLTTVNIENVLDEATVWGEKIVPKSISGVS